MKSYWLIEYTGATPVPIYVPADFVKSHGCYTCSAWEARRFDTKTACEKWMADPDGCQPFIAPWAAISHGFTED